MGLRVGLTGGLGSGKSTVAALLAGHGAHVLSADELGRQLMEPGTAVFDAIAKHFGPAVVSQDGRLKRVELARLAFAEGRVEELNAIVHPATIALQSQLAAELFASAPEAILVVESALLFETQFGKGWKNRFDKLVLVTAPDELKVARFVARTKLDPAEARARLARQIPDAEKTSQCDFILNNGGTLEALNQQVDDLWVTLSSVR